MNAEIEKEVLKCVQALRDGGFIIFPSEIGWSIGCDAASNEDVEAILNSGNNLFPALLLDASGRLGKYVKTVPDAIWDLIEFSVKPLHLLMEETINFPSTAFSDAATCAFRIVKDEFTLAVAQKFGKPIFAAVLEATVHPAKVNSILNKNCYVVNLRAGAKANPDHLVVMRLLKGGKFEIIRK